MADVGYTSSGEEADFEDDNDDGETDDKKHGTAGMADVISKILSKKVKGDNEGIILSKYKEGKKRKQQEAEEAHEKNENAKRKAEFREKNHVVPDRSNAEKEVQLRRIGTKGVVKLFNAVSKHQKEMESKLKKASTIGKKEKVLETVSKSSFLDILKTNASSKEKDKIKDNETHSNNKVSEQAETTSTPSWKILRDDFMMGSKIKDWDKEDESADNEDQNEVPDDSDAGSEDDSEA